MIELIQKAGLKIGRDSEAVAGYGLSIKRAKLMLETGIVPWRAPGPQLVPYQEDLIKDGGFLYYALPIYENLIKSRFSFAQQIKEGYPNFSDFQFAQEFLPEKIVSQTGEYAFSDGMAQSYLERTGHFADANELVPVVANGISEDEFTAWLKNPFIKQLSNMADFRFNRKAVLATLARLSPEQLRNYAFEVINQQAAIIWFNERFLHHQLLPGYEDEREIMVKSKNPITLNAVSSIEILT